MRQQVMRNTGIPISIGAAPSKTLAKIANKLAKECITGVCVLDTAEKIQQALKNFPVSDVWGIGRKYGKKYQKHDIYFAGQIVDKSVEWMQKEFTIHGVRMWYELQGLSTLQLGVKREPKKAIACSKSFGKPTSRISDLSEAISSYASRVGEKLREERSCAGILSVQLSTNRFKKDQTYYSPYISIPLAYPCNNTSMLVKMAVEAVHRLYKPNYQFIKAAVMVTGLIPESEVQLNVFTTWKDQDKLSKVLDSLNSHYGKGTLRMASEGFLKPWNMRQEYLSPAYTTRWKDIIKVN